MNDCSARVVTDKQTLCNDCGNGSSCVTQSNGTLPAYAPTSAGFLPPYDEQRSTKDEENYKLLNPSEYASVLHANINGSQDKCIEDCPINLIYLFKGLNCPLPQEYSASINNRPDWLDLDKFKAGQRFAMDHFSGLIFSKMISLFLLLSTPNGIEPLVFTDKSSTPFTAYKRYLSTALRIKSWYEDDIWSEGNEGFENIKAVRAMHLNISNKLNKSSREEIKKNLTLEGSIRHPNLWCPLSSKWGEYFKSIGETTFNKITRGKYYKRDQILYLSQTEMSVTQFAFFGLMVMYPHKFGAGAATRQDLENFVHCWRGLGYLLGINDEFNFCKGSFDEVLQRCHDLVNDHMKPNFPKLTRDWEHMSRCAVQGLSFYIPGNSFEAAFAYLCWTIGIDASRYYSSLTWAQYLQFTWFKFIFGFVLRIPAVLPMLNTLIIRVIEAQKSMPSERLELLKQKKI